MVEDAESQVRYVYRSGKLGLEAKSISELQHLISKVVAATKKRSVSVVIPTYNEEGNIGRLVDAVSSSLSAADVKDFEIVVVDDASRDKTPELMDKYAAAGNVAAVHRYGVRGIFSAILDGVKVARSDIVVIMDADFSHPPAKVPELLKRMEEGGFDLVSGSRFANGGRIEAPFIRKAATVLFNGVIRFVMGGRITDWTGGFHAIRRDKLLSLNFKYPAKWGEFDLELLYRAKKAGLKTAEVPFAYSFREEGESKSAERLSFLLGYAWLYGKRAVQLRFLD
ncbi:polyprenol monophosphomannose synthase [Candidatus Woesearchaeota archaeon]|nr:polyprenol monophosphomannose synthase [Candidatus Woesearchaeota archaeon]